MAAAPTTQLTFAQRWRYHLPAIMLYTILVLGFTFPLITQLNTHIPGDPSREDYWVHLWTFDWIGQSVATQVNPYYTDLIFAPAGVSLASHNIAWLNIAIWLPLRAVAGPIAAYNLIMLLIYLFNCSGMYLLATELGLRRPAAFLAGCVAGFWPYLISHYDHPNLIMIGWVPLCLLYLHRFWGSGHLSQALLAALALILFGFGRWQLLIMGLFIMLPYCLFLLWRFRPVTIASRWQGIALIGGLSSIGLLFMFWPILQAFSGSGDINEVLYAQARGQVDLAAYFLPSRYHPVWGAWATGTATFATLRFNTLYIPVLLFSTVPLVIWGWWRHRPVSHLWLALTVLIILMALGAPLRFRGISYDQIPMLYDLIDEFILMRVLRRSDRFNILLGIPFGLLAAWGWQSLFHVRRRWLGYLWISLILFEALPTPFPTTDTRITPIWYETLAAEEGEFAILDLPISRIPQKLSMFYQLTHGKALVTGKIARIPAVAYEFMGSIPILSELLLSGRVNQAYPPVSATLATLAENEIRYVVIHKNGLDNGQARDFASWLGLRPRYEDADLAVYTTTPQEGIDFVPFFTASESLKLVEATFSEDGLLQLLWHANEIPGQNQHLCWGNAADQAQIEAWTCHPIVPGYPLAVWQKGALVRQSLSIITPSNAPLWLAVVPVNSIPGTGTPALKVSQ